jgi:hypothetical protein
VGILFWVKCSTMDFIERMDKVGLLSCLSRILFYISYLRIELISVVISVCCSLP